MVDFTAVRTRFITCDIQFNSDSWELGQKRFKFFQNIFLLFLKLTYTNNVLEM